MVALKTMRRFITTFLLVVLSIHALAQTADGTLKFLGIPVDGSKQEMITQLKTKGFQYFSHNDCLVGQFNGKVVEIHIMTNHGVVDRVYVEYPEVSSVSQIISEFNTLLGQFNRNKKYITPRENKPIPETEHIDYEMSINNKQYEAGFLYLSPDLFSDKEVEQIHLFMDKIKGLPSNEISKNAEEFALSILPQDSPEEANAFVQKWMTVQNGCVWFTIHKKYGQFQISLYYDNMKNRPNGEDL